MSKQRPGASRAIPAWLERALSVGAETYGEIPARFCEHVVVPALSDLNKPFAVELIVGVRGDTLWVSERDEAGSAGIGVSDVGTPSAASLVFVADWLQEQVFPETRGAWGQARPSCPGHPHPAQPELREGVTSARRVLPQAPASPLRLPVLDGSATITSRS